MAVVTMLLAHGPDHPDGNTADQIKLTLQLTPQGRIDEAAYARGEVTCTLARQGAAGETSMGEIVRLSSGWALRRTGQEDDPLWNFEGTVFRPGEYVTLNGPEDRELVFRIVNVEST